MKFTPYPFTTSRSLPVSTRRRYDIDIALFGRNVFTTSKQTRRLFAGLDPPMWFDSCDLRVLFFFILAYRNIRADSLHEILKKYHFKTRTGRLYSCYCKYEIFFFKGNNIMAFNPLVPGFSLFLDLEVIGGQSVTQRSMGRDPPS